MATATNGRLRETVEFDLNVPVEISLKYAQGKIISTRNGERVMFTTCDDKVMFLDLGPAQKINELGVNVGEKICIAKQKKGAGPVEWACWLHPETEKRRAEAEAKRNPPEPPSELEKQLAASIELARLGKLGEQGNGSFAIMSGAKVAPFQSTPPTRGGELQRQATPKPAPTQEPVEDPLITEANALVDVYAQVMERALRKYEGRIKPDEVRSLLVSAYIQRSKAGH